MARATCDCGVKFAFDDAARGHCHGKGQHEACGFDTQGKLRNSKTTLFLEIDMGPFYWCLRSSDPQQQRGNLTPAAAVESRRKMPHILSPFPFPGIHTLWSGDPCAPVLVLRQQPLTLQASLSTSEISCARRALTFLSQAGLARLGGKGLRSR